MANTRSVQNRQTRLSFSPLPTSSPNRAQQPEAIRDRAAAVTFTDTSIRPSRKRTTIRDYLPSPDASSDRVSQIKSSLDQTSPSRLARSFMSGSRQSQNDKSEQNPAISKMNKFGILDESESDTPFMHSSPTKKSLKRKLLDPSEDDESQSESSSGPYSKKYFKRSGKKRLPNPSSAENSDTDNAEVNNEPSERSDSDNNDGDDDEDELPSRPTRRSTKSSQSTNIRRQDQADIDEDLEFLGDIDAESPRGTRKSSTKKSAKQEALEALKKKRLQRNAQSTDPVFSLHDELSENSEPHLSEVDENMETADLDADASDFVIEDDDDDTIGQPVDLPFEFSTFRTMKAKHLFKFAVEWMVQKKMNPGFTIDDPRYKIAFDRLDDFVRGLGGSKFQSSAWTSSFSRALKTRPKLKSHQFMAETLFRDRCDACNRSGHPATWEAAFSGKTYNSRTLEEDSDDDSDEESESSKPSETFYIGRFCMQNARTAHALAHWRFHLNEWVVDYLKNIGELTSKKIVRRDGWSTSKRRRDADRIVEKMENEGEIKALHRDFKNEVSQAQFSNDRSAFYNSSP